MQVEAKRKRSRKWAWAVGAALVVLLLVGALLFREQPPYEFLHGMERIRTTISGPTPRYPAYAVNLYVTDLRSDEFFAAMSAELQPKGWHCDRRVCTSPGGTEVAWVEPIQYGGITTRWTDEELTGNAFVMTQRPANWIDRFLSWIGRLSGP